MLPICTIVLENDDKVNIQVPEFEKEATFAKIWRCLKMTFWLSINVRYPHQSPYSETPSMWLATHTVRWCLQIEIGATNYKHSSQ